ncbi:MAG TPA: PAS domain-containing protein [Polyangiaceae bacterium]
MIQSLRHGPGANSFFDDEQRRGPGLRRTAPQSGKFLRRDAERPTDAGALLEPRPTGVREPPARWRVAASTIPTLIFVRTTGAIVAANDAAARAYRATREELLESFISDLVPPSERIVDRLLLRVRHPQTMWTGPLLQRRTDGSTFWAEIAVVETGATGTTTMAIVVKVQDPTDDRAGEG